MAKWIILLVLGILLVGGDVFLGIKIADVTEQLNDLKSSQLNYESSKYDSLKSDYDLLQGKIAELQSVYGKLEAKNENLQRLLQPTLALNTPEIAGLTVTISGGVIPVELVAGTTSTARITEQNWDWGDGISTSSWFPASHNYAKGGTYTITVTVHDSNGLSTTKTTTVIVQPALGGS